MKAGKILTIIALACVAVFAIGVLAFGLATGFGFGDFFDTIDTGVYETPYTYTEEAEYLREISVSWSSGPVSLSFYDGDVIRVTETAKHALKEEEKLLLELSGGELSIRWSSEWLHLDFMRDTSKKLEVQIPRQFANTLDSVSIETASANIEVENLAAAEASFHTISGNLELKNIRAEELKVSSTSGDILGESLTGSEKLRAESVSGKITLTALTADALELDTTSGEIHIEGAAAELYCDSVSGDIALAMQKWAEEAEISSVSGKVAVTAPETADGFTCEFSSVSGDFHCGFAAQKEKDIYVVGAGKAEMKISTTSGDVRLEPAA